MDALCLLLSDEGAGGSSLKDAGIMRITGISSSTVERLRKRCCGVGLLAALERKPRAPPAHGQDHRGCPGSDHPARLHGATGRPRPLNPSSARQPHGGDRDRPAGADMPDRRLGSVGDFKREVEACLVAKNGSPKPIKWQFTDEKARIKLKSLYPSI